MKIIITENKLEKAAISWLNKNYGDLESFETEKYPDYIFYKKGNDVIFDYNKKNGYVYVSYGEIWSFLSSFFSMEYEQIQDITKVWVEEHYNLRGITTIRGFKINNARLRNVTI